MAEDAFRWQRRVKMRTYQPHQAIVMEANASSPTGAPKLKSVIIKNVPDPATRRLLLQQGDADMLVIWEPIKSMHYRVNLA